MQAVPEGHAASSAPCDPGGGRVSVGRFGYYLVTIAVQASGGTFAYIYCYK
ncbi:hypothetical protein GCM10010191_15550 [Actinomadura vinacea]|uniref:Uncharacterized protein n=1 Tax=Actinomadura vinacea TaxID=115336 RepID=A0ABN3INK6_9ACTN